MHNKAARINFWSDVKESACGLWNGFFHPMEKHGKEEVWTRCTHLGCKLSWNPDEKSWDCPCHGSRFTEDGKRLDEPAQKDLPDGDLDKSHIDRENKPGV